MSNFIMTVFSDGSIVSKKSLYQNKQEFLNDCSAYDQEEVCKKCLDEDHVVEAYVRFTPRPKNDDEFPGGCYEISTKKTRGSFEVYALVMFYGWCENCKCHYKEFNLVDGNCPDCGKEIELKNINW